MTLEKIIDDYQREVINDTTSFVKESIISLATTLIGLARERASCWERGLNEAESCAEKIQEKMNVEIEKIKKYILQ